MRSYFIEVVFHGSYLPVRLSSILNQPYKGLVVILSLKFKFQYFPGGGGGWSGEKKIKASLISAELEPGMSLAKYPVEIFDLQFFDLYFFTKFCRSALG